MNKLFEQFKKETGDNWSYKNGWDFAPDEIIVQNYIEWLEQKLTSDNSDYAKYEMYQCPYEKACHCKMDEPCKGCETWAKHFA